MINSRTRSIEQNIACFNRYRLIDGPDQVSSLRDSHGALRDDLILWKCERAM